jgi:hypothetical protein
MQIYIHRINTIEKLSNIPTKYGVEIDIRGFGNQLLLNHDPLKDDDVYDTLEDYLAHYQQIGIKGGIIFNTKEAGYEKEILNLATKFNITNYFLLDVEFPYLYRATRKEGVRQIAVRYSEAEPIEAVEAQTVDGHQLLDWVWIDTNTRLPLDTDTVSRLEPFKTCLVCPERWGRPEDIPRYAAQMKELNFTPTAVMTALSHAETWENLYTI